MKNSNYRRSLPSGNYNRPSTPVLSRTVHTVLKSNHPGKWVAGIAIGAIAVAGIAIKAVNDIDCRNRMR